MKKITLVLVFICFAFQGFAQAYDDDLKLVQSVYGMEKKEVVGQFVELTDSQNDEFWKLYDEYEIKRQKLGKKGYDIFWNYVNDYGSIKPADAEMFMKEVIPLRKSSDELVRTYYNKIKNKTDAVVATQFYQIENYLADMVRTELLENLYISKKD